LRSETNAQIVSPNIATGGVSTVTFYASSSTASGSVQVNYSTDGGSTWLPATGSPFSLTNGAPSFKTATINSTSNNIQVQFRRTAAVVYIDDIVITAAAIPTTLDVSATSLPDFGSVNIGTSSSPATFTVTGSGLTSEVTVTGSAEFPVSADNVLYSESIQISNSGSLEAV